MKQKLIFVISIVFLLICLFLFTGIIGKPVFVYLPLAEDKIHVDSSKESIKSARTVLKYNEDIKSVNVSSDYMDNIHFIPQENNIKEFVVDGRIKNWEALKYCENLEKLLLLNSNFTDFSLLESMHKVKIICIESSEEIKYSDFKCFECLEELTINAPNVDIKNISNASTTEYVWIENANKIINYENIRYISGLKRLCIIKSDIDIEFLEIISTIEFDDLYISNCHILNSESEGIIKVLEEFRKKGFTINCDNNIVNVKLK